MAEEETERLERFVELWDKGLIEAAERAQKCPAKEGGAAKAFMARENTWKKLDAAIRVSRPVIDEVA